MGRWEGGKIRHCSFKVSALRAVSDALTGVLDALCAVSDALTGVLDALRAVSDAWRDAVPRLSQNLA